MSLIHPDLTFVRQGRSLAEWLPEPIRGSSFRH
jgi:hypothetical protein